MQERPGYIDAVMSTQFDECSIAAADASKIAHETFIDTAPHEIYANIVDEFHSESLTKLEYVPKSTITLEHNLVAEPVSSIMLTRTTHEEGETTGLSILINGDMFLPIATFAKRTDGQCSYVQMGQEMIDDNIVVTPNGPRQEYVEAFRQLLRSSEELSADQEALIKNIIDQELEKYSQSIEAMLPASVARRAEKYFELFKTRGEKHVHVLNDDEWINGVLAPITIVTDQEDDQIGGRDVELALVREVGYHTETETIKRTFGKPKVRSEVIREEAESLQLMAITRGDVAVRLASINPESGVVTLDDYDKPANTESLKHILLAVGLLAETDRSILANLKGTLQKAVKSQKSLLISYNFDDIVLVSRHDGGYASPKYRDENGHDRGGYAFEPQSWQQFKVNALNTLSGYRRGNPIVHAVCDNMQVDHMMSGFLSHFDVAGKIETYIGPGNSEAEHLMCTILGGLATSQVAEYTAKGILKDKRAGKTVTDVDTSVTLSNGNGEVKVQVKGRPLALDGFEPVTIFDERLDLTAVNDIPEDKVKEISEVIAAICFKPETT